MINEPEKDDRSFNLLGLVKACTIRRDLDKGSKLHAYIREHKLLEKTTYIGSALVNMYGKCGALLKAEQVLKELPVRDVIAWNALIAGYVRQEQGWEALKCLDDMLDEGHLPTAVTFISALKACGSIRAIDKGEEIHDKIVSLGMIEKNIVLGTTLVHMYVKCGALAKAQQVIEELPVRDAVAWNSIIAGYAQQGQGEQALKCFDDMLHEGHTPDAISFICVLKACRSLGASGKGKDIHDKIVSLGMLKKDIVLGNSLVYMYAKCGALLKAQQVLKELPIRNAMTWNALIVGFIDEGQGEEAIKCFNDMLHDGHSPTVVTFVCVLKACGSIGAASKGKEIHEKIVSSGILEKDIVLGAALVDMYVNCNALPKAQQVLEELPIRNVVSWSALISGYAKQGQGEEALKCFDNMLFEGHTPTAVTFACVLRACGIIGAVARGEEIHSKIVNLGMLEKDIILATTLVDMYAKCGALAKAQQVLIELPVRNVVSWSALIAGYAEQGQGEEALKCFNNMLHEGHSPTAVTFVSALKACGSMRAGAKGKEIHDKIVSLGMLEKNFALGTSLVDMYMKCGALAHAHQVFEELPVHDVISWSALIAGYAEQGKGEEALKCFDNMVREGHTPDVITCTCALNACGGIGAASKGEEIQQKIVGFNTLEKNTVLWTALLDLYVNCGAFSKVQQVVEEVRIHDVVSWCALIAGYAQWGQTVEAVNCFQKMQSNKVKPNTSVLTSVLNACSHSGLLDQAESYFSGMSTEYGIHPNLEHYCCMTDLFGRTGNFKKALSFISEMPYDMCIPCWVALLGACRKWEEVRIGRLAFEHAVHMDKSNDAVYLLLLDIYMAVGMQEEAVRVQGMRLADESLQIVTGLMQPEKYILCEDTSM